MQGNRNQVPYASPEDLTTDLRRVWCNAEDGCAGDATTVISFGGITDRRAEPLDLIEDSIRDRGWRIATIEEAGSATQGKRQDYAFLRSRSKPMAEYDVLTTKK